MASNSFGREVVAALSAEEKKALARVRWVDRLLSLWAPVTIFVLVFGVYIVVIENAECAYLWLQPLLKAFGVLCLIYYAVTVAVRWWRPFHQRRQEWHRGEELISSTDALLKKFGNQVPARAREELVAAGAEVLKAMPGPQPQLHEANEGLLKVSSKHLSKWPSGGMVGAAGGFAKALAVALLVRTVLIEPYKIPSGSMLPTLEVGDHLFVNKFLYGVRIPFTNWVPFIIVREPRRGDVIVFNNPVQPDLDFIKRVVGVPGDRIDFDGRQLVINGVPQPLRLETDNYRVMDMSQATQDWESKHLTLSREALDGRDHYVLHRPPFSEPWTSGTVVVPPKSVFVMGDNRDNSLDSRFGLGTSGGNEKVEFVPYGNIKGKAMVIWLSLGYKGVLSGLFGGTGLRTDRLYLPVTLCGDEAKRESAGEQ